MTFAIIYMTFWVVAGVGLIRNAFVYSERIKMVKIIFSQKEWETYDSLIDNVSYDYMMFHFWIWPVSKMWPEELRKLRGN